MITGRNEHANGRSLPLASPAFAPLQVAPADVDRVLSNPLDALEQHARVLVLTVDADLQVQAAAGRYAEMADLATIGHPLGTGRFPLPLLERAVAEAVADGQVRRLDLPFGSKVLDVVVQPLEAGSSAAVVGAVIFGQDVTDARRSARRAVTLSRIAPVHGDDLDDPVAVLQRIARAVAEHTGAGVVVRTVRDAQLEGRAIAHPDPAAERDLALAVNTAGSVPLARMSVQLSEALGPVTVDWDEWARTLWLPVEARQPLEDRGARAVMSWVMRAEGQVLGLILVTLMDGTLQDPSTDEGERGFLTDVAALASLQLETALSRRRAAEAAEELARSEARFRSAFDAAPVGMVLTSAEPGHPGVVTRVNEAYTTIVGRPASEVVGRAIEELVHPLDADEVRRLVGLVAGGVRNGFTVEHRVRRPDGTLRWVRVYAKAAGGPDGPAQIVGHVEDVTEHRATQEELARRALYDSLTGLPNRNLSLDHLRRALQGLRRHPGRVAVLFGDLDRFKAINDTYGHEIGDRVLVEVAARLRATVRSEDTPGRLGGDEFLVVCRDAGSDDDVRQMVERLLAALDEPVVVRIGSGHAELRVGASIGVSVTSDAHTPPDRMLYEADTAMYEAKRLGRGQFHVYQEQLGHAADRRARIEHDLRVALDEGRWVLHYQPIVDLVSGRVHGVEALLRMRDPLGDLVLPGEFIDVAEESALIHPIGDWLMGEACRQLAAWQRMPRRGPLLTMAVNVTGRQAAKAAASGSVLRAVAEAGVAEGTLSLEVTERTLLDAGDGVVADLERLTAAGVHLAIDDFGTGYSSLAYLQRFPVATVKIDRSFVAGLGVNARDDAIVAAVAALGSTLGLQVVAEGVESPEQVAHLLRLGCTVGQGFHLGRPCPAEELTALLEGDVPDEQRGERAVDQ
ncbi:EAL domain-containing protein [Cellulomonas soli]|uniref:putative bifunctional diguanylate cyclase/phosphodiesterase n=1 Tax=Cellulomonas soli TaxID=931535 RepID=UPI003F83780C